ncbi:MAG: 3'-5' exoribonuclease [Dehalococcoidia bacterium]|nr:3'-5' exoribonuclease [Dehalococcoidia bacterium]
MIPSGVNNIYISLDIETTGLDNKTDEIIEIGAVRFNETGIINKYESLVNPYKKLPEFITDLTGIKQYEVDNASAFSMVSQDLESFIGNDIIIGQNIEFDLGFLSNKGLTLLNQYYDTRDIAHIILPRAKDYSLGSLARELNITHDNPHRALADAEITSYVFLQLKSLVAKLDETLLNQIRNIYSKSDSHLKTFFATVNSTTSDAPANRDSKIEQKKEQPYTYSHNEKTAANTNNIHTSTGDDRITLFFDQKGPLSSVIENYTQRPQQNQLSCKVYNAINNNGTLLVEGGTGIGKSMAYLLPAILFSLEQDSRVVISTNTINLQEQLINKDLPTIKKALTSFVDTDYKLNFSLLKGKDNYLCLEKWEGLLREDSFSKDEARLAAKLAIWINDTNSGDRTEINLSARDRIIWSKISSAYSNDCPSHHQTRSSKCFLAIARQKAEDSHIVVVNHALLMRDAIDGGGIIPSYNDLVIDEAHNLEEETTNQYGSKISSREIVDLVNEINAANGIVSKTVVALEKLDPGSRKDILSKVVGKIKLNLKGLDDTNKILWNTLFDFVMNQDLSKARRQKILRINHSTRTQPDWSTIEVSWEQNNTALLELKESFLDLHLALDNAPKKNATDSLLLTTEISDVTTKLDEFKKALHDFVIDPHSENIYWVTTESNNEDVLLHTAPIHVGKILKEKLFSKKDSVIITSATLSTNGNFEYTKDRLGLIDAEEISVESPFNYQKAVLLCLPTDMPNPDHHEYQNRLQDIIVEICNSANGRTMVLFTSHAALQTTRSGIKNLLEPNGFKVLAQGLDGNPYNLRSMFMENSSSVLLGTSSFWQGVDLPGDSLKALIVARLPFSVPTDPIFSARAELLDDPFNQYTIPQTILRFRQGFGRLIRTEQDQGVVAILDHRILSKSYGPMFINSLPTCTTVKSSILEMYAAISKWIK